MERLGIYIFVFFIAGLTLLERVRTKGYSGTAGEVFWRNAGILLFAMAAYLFWANTIIEKGFGGGWIRDAREWYSAIPSNSALLIRLSLKSLYASAAALIVGAGIWELKIPLWKKLLATGVFCLMVYPVFGWAQSGNGFLGNAGFQDYRGALLNWTLPSSFVLGLRLALPGHLLPGQRNYQIRGGRIIPGMKLRFFLSRGIGLTTVFLILNATVLEGYNWFVSKTITLIPASFAVLFSQVLFFAIWGRNPEERKACAPPILAILSAFVGTQAFREFPLWAAAVTAAVTTFLVMIYLRHGPLGVRTWDPVCSVPVFLFGGVGGSLFASLSPSVSLLPQCFAVLFCLIFGIGTGAVLGALSFSKPPRI